MSPNRVLGVAFAILAVVQTAIPIVVQKMSYAVVFREYLHGSIALCVIVGTALALFQIVNRRFSIIGLALFSIGVTLLVAFDVWIEEAVDASC
jgi:hypothetical protein